ncbi:MAG: ComEC/Rec2 family competence protein, partial [Eubacterium sp.]|nr:ComEC/Rec2 family competence protein [Eubacterium sp.]
LVLLLGLRLKKKPYITFIVFVINLFVFITPVTSDGILPSFSRDGLYITNLDVGQGDCCCIQTPEGKCVLIDGGSTDIKEVGRYRIVPFLKYYGIDTIDYMIITHSDADHISGLSEILADERHFGLTVNHVVMPDIQNKDENYLAFERLIPGGPLYIKTGDAIRIGEVTLTCLHPSIGFQWEDVNDYSTVLELEYKDFHGLFTGDLGFHGEEEMVQEIARVQREIPDVDYLKVGHHGSKNSSSEAFLSRVRPEIAVASAGENNRYHHPAKEALERLDAVGAYVYCTKEAGAVTTWTDGEQIRVSEFID